MIDIIRFAAERDDLERLGIHRPILIPDDMTRAPITILDASRMPPDVLLASLTQQHQAILNPYCIDDRKSMHYPKGAINHVIAHAIKERSLTVLLSPHILADHRIMVSVRYTAGLLHRIGVPIAPISNASCPEELRSSQDLCALMIALGLPGAYDRDLILLHLLEYRESHAYRIQIKRNL